MSVFCCKCGTGRTRNVVNHVGEYVCLECLLFNHGLSSKVPGRYSDKIRREVKMVLMVARCVLPDVCSLDDLGYYLVSDVELEELRRAIRIEIARVAPIL